MFTKARYTAVRYEFPSGKMHLSILTSVFYIIPIPTSLFLLTFTSLHLSIDTNGRTDSSSVVFQVTCSPKQEPKLRLLSLRKPLELPYEAWHTEQDSLPSLFPSRKAMSRCTWSGALLLLCFLFKVNEHGYGISLAEAAGGKACNLQYVRLHTRCGEGRMEGVV